ncbi:hypothetical protein I312_103415 [Cryptococcus bacillisporus CA1280]|uniref:uncharacterized protein n=1 Tax=Cryptococcus bacillisporus CA1280 TaxID=1296109 RepID=UPI0033699932
MITESRFNDEVTGLPMLSAKSRTNDPSPHQQIKQYYYCNNTTTVAIILLAYRPGIDGQRTNEEADNRERRAITP